MTRDTVFDLASLTKPLATTLAVVVLIQQGRLGLSQTLADLIGAFGNSDKASISIEQLLLHTSGFPDYRPFYQSITGVDSRQRQAALRQLLVAEPIAAPPGTRTLYSDLGFMALNWVVETVSRMRLDRLVRENIYRPLGLSDLFFVDAKNPRTGSVFAATEHCAWRGLLLEGVVHDENAYAVGGVEGHAGLFGTARAVHGLLSVLCAAYAGQERSTLFRSSLIRRFLDHPPGGERALGFDRPAASGSSSGRFFSPHTVGHLGFTGVSFWMDLERSILVVLLTNRVHPTRSNEKIKRFRPILHDAVMRGLGVCPS